MDCLPVRPPQLPQILGAAEEVDLARDCCVPPGGPQDPVRRSADSSWRMAVNHGAAAARASALRLLSLQRPAAAAAGGDVGAAGSLPPSSKRPHTTRLHLVPLRGRLELAGDAISTSTPLLAHLR